MLSVKKVVLNPKFLQPVGRIIRTEAINSFGETVTNDIRSTIHAAVSSPNQQDLLRLPEGTVYVDVIRVTTATQLNTATMGHQPDRIEYHGEHYIVKLTNDYNIYGYTRALCILTDLQGQPVR